MTRTSKQDREIVPIKRRKTDPPVPVRAFAFTGMGGNGRRWISRRAWPTLREARYAMAMRRADGSLVLADRSSFVRVTIVPDPQKFAKRRPVV